MKTRGLLTASAAVVIALASWLGVMRFQSSPYLAVAGPFKVAPGTAPRVEVRTDPYYLARRRLFEATPGSAELVMLGDSITEHGNWNEIVPGLRVMNRGISGDTSAGVLGRLAEVLGRRPKFVALMIGTNDKGSPEETASNVRAIVADLRASGSQVIVHAVLPRSGVNPERNSGLNRQLEAVATQTGATFLDLGPHLAPSGSLEPRFTWDGLHLTGEAYLVWRDALIPLVTAQ